MISHFNCSFLHAEMIVRSCFINPITFCCWEGGKPNVVNEYVSCAADVPRFVPPVV
ncbi:hypothetical protein L210DRAFT_3520838 [Boletus edulis BED1]|uniref:Uncharacterized protein n=1 Tax=Boletus edulis BED1 TaxID=1328754 RepID=A0AAD4GM21_BOLED|nr:hypothetical protein L210DRAFT_3520838 [Boletus edulis BED1]